MRVSPIPFALATGLAAAALSATPAAEPQPAVLPHGEPMALILADEFDGDDIDWGIWKSLQPGDEIPKRSTLRGPDNLEVRDGQLLIHVRKEDREHRGRITNWTAGYIYTREPIPNNVYLETRFLPTMASGVNNSFWLSCIGTILTDETWQEERTWRDRYEIDVVEARLDIRHEEPTARVHLAWVDWKTRGTIPGNGSHIAQGIHMEHPWEEAQTWGLWYGEEEMIWYLNGREVWRGKTHRTYHDQWWSGLGKYDQWPTDDEKRAYGRFGQADWSYNGGYTGDRMNVCFSTSPWGDTWTPLTDEAHDTYMAIDYFRMYKPKRLLETEPLQRLTDRLSPAPGESAAIDAAPAIPTDAPHPRYFSLLVNREQNAAFSLALEDSHGAPLWQLATEPDGSLAISLDSPVRTARTTEAHPASERETEIVPAGQTTLLVIRMTPGLRDGKTAISARAFDPADLAGAMDREPYFHSNIDAHGNTSLNNEWDINLKGFVVEDGVRFQLTNEGAGNVQVTDLRQGNSFRSVVRRLEGVSFQLTDRKTGAVQLTDLRQGNSFRSVIQRNQGSE